MVISHTLYPLSYFLFKQLAVVFHIRNVTLLQGNQVKSFRIAGSSSLIRIVVDALDTFILVSSSR